MDITLTFFLFCVATNVLHTEPYRFFFFILFFFFKYFQIKKRRRRRRKKNYREHVNLFAFSLKIYNPYVVCVLYIISSSGNFNGLCTR